MPSLDAELAAEQAHLERARAELARMREATEALDASKASDAVSGEVLGWVLARRIASLQDDPETTLFFGRIDTRSPGAPAEDFHIGRRHVTDAAGDPLVVDWRAPISTGFYRASVAQPMDVVRRRRFGVHAGRLTAIEDEWLVGDAVSGAGRSALLAAEIERPRTGPMRDIVSTIQPEQDEIVRGDVATTICVQGAPGTGKTAVGLHRAAWLLYSFRQRLDRSGVLVVGPNRAFLDHIGAVLPSLGEVRVAHATIETLVAHAPVRADDPVEVARLKGDRRLAEVLSRAVWSQVRPASDPSSSRAGSASGGCPPTRSRTSSTSSRPARSATRPRGATCPNGSPITCCWRWRRPERHRTTGSRTPSPGLRPSSAMPPRSGRPSIPPPCCTRSSRTPRRSLRHPRTS